MTDPTRETVPDIETRPTDPAPAPVPLLTWEDTGVCLGDLSEQERRDGIARIAAGFVGLGAKDVPPGRADAYALAIGRGESAAFRRSYVPTEPATNWNASSCGLTVRAVYGAAGCQDSRLVPPYSFAVEGGAMGQLRALATRSGAFRLYDPRRPDELPQVGDAVFLGAGQHIYLVCAREHGEMGHTSCEGGQLGGWGGGSEALSHVRTFAVRDRTRLVSIDGNGHERPVLWSIDGAALSFTRTALHPVRSDLAPVS